MSTKSTPKCECSQLQKHRCAFQPVLPNILKKGPAAVKAKAGKATKSVADQAAVKRIFPNTYGLPEITFVKGANTAVCKKAVRVGVVLSGGQAPGGHNVIGGLLDGLKKANSKNKLFVAGILCILFCYGRFQKVCYKPLCIYNQSILNGKNDSRVSACYSKHRKTTGNCECVE